VSGNNTRLGKHVKFSLKEISRYWTAILKSNTNGTEMVLFNLEPQKVKHTN